MRNASDSSVSSGSARFPIRVGIGGWVFPSWRGGFYPPGLLQRRELDYASRRLGAIEINGTYYGAQKPATYAKWRAETPDGFVFSLKAPRYCTHARQLATVGNNIDGFVFGGLAELQDRLGPILWQFTPQRRFDRDDLSAFLDRLPCDLDGRPLRHVIEVRHDSFLCEAYLELARARGVASVFTDSADYPSFADITGDFVYARLMRSRESVTTGYENDALDAWAYRARTWAAGGSPPDLPHVGDRHAALDHARDVFIYFISAAKARNPAAAMALIDKL